MWHGHPGGELTARHALRSAAVRISAPAMPCELVRSRVKAAKIAASRSAAVQRVVSAV